MAEKFDLLSGIDENTATGSGAAAANASQAAPGVGSQLFITGFSITFGVSATAAGTAQIRRNAGATVIKQFNLPIGPCTLIYEFKRPIRVPDNQSADLDVAGATTATVRVELYTITRPTTV